MQAKAYKGIGMEGRIAKWYAATTRKDVAEFKTLANRMAAGLPSGGSVLEVAPGPGYFAIELAKRGNYKITGLDISETFVDIARRNAKEEGAHVDFQKGNASAMAFADETFDLIVCRAAFKNFSEPVMALKETRRVLKSGGKAVIIDLRRDVSRDAIDQYVDKMDMSFVNSVFTKLTFRFMLIKRAYTEAEFRKMISESGFEKVQIEGMPVGFEISLVK